MWNYKSSAELYHHGVVGQKWGVRRYQNKDGSLTKAGKTKRASTVEATKKEEPTKKRAKDLSDDELRSAISRKRLENDYNTLYPEKVSAGKKFVNAAVNKVVLPALTEGAKQVAKEFIVSQSKKALNLPSGGDSKKDKD